MALEHPIIARLRKMLLASKDSQNAIATATGISQPHLNRFANGQKSLSMEHADTLARFFGYQLKLVPRSRAK